jgi:hypothetical protein
VLTLKCINKNKSPKSRAGTDFGLNVKLVFVCGTPALFVPEKTKQEYHTANVKTFF